MEIDVKKNREILEKIMKDNDIDKDTLDFYKMDIQWFLDNHYECKYEDNLEKNCHQNHKGFMDSLEYANNRFYRTLRPCNHTIYQENKEQYLKNFLFVDFAPLVYDSPFSTRYLANTKIKENIDLYIKEPKDLNELLKRTQMSKDEYELKSMIVKRFVKQLHDNNYIGIYLYGPMGTGKTTLFRLLALYAANEGKTVAFTNVANLANKLKEGFKNNSDANIISDLQDADVLFLDDIGGETATDWLRDDVLYTILNYRMTNHKMTFMTSNLSIKELAKHYNTTKTRSNTTVTKDARLMERINVLAKEIKLDANDHRIKN